MRLSRSAIIIEVTFRVATRLGKAKRTSQPHMSSCASSNTPQTQKAQHPRDQTLSPNTDLSTRQTILYIHKSYATRVQGRLRHANVTSIHYFRLAFLIDRAHASDLTLGMQHDCIGLSCCQQRQPASTSFEYGRGSLLQHKMVPCEPLEGFKL